jgi:hypothetical protein
MKTFSKLALTPPSKGLLICKKNDLIDVNFGVDPRRFWKKFTFRILLFWDPSLSLLLPFLLHITCHMSHDIITPKLLEQGTCIFRLTENVHPQKEHNIP